MKVTFVANFMNHHQLSFSKMMLDLTGGEYCFVAHSPIYAEQVSLGYEDMNMLPFVIRSYESEKSYSLALERMLNDDMVIFGGCPNEWVELRAKTGKPFLIYSERFFKKGTYRRFIPITYKKIYDRMLKYKNNNMAVMCSSAFLPYDLKLLHTKMRTIKWGYFPKVHRFEDLDSLMNSKEENTIIWVGRFIKLKHPEAPIRLAKRLKDEGYKFKLKMIGNGLLLEKMIALVKKLDLQENVKIMGAMPPSEVRKQMEASCIMICSSDQHEGWGAVVNEAMNSGCAVIASHLIGSVPFLIKNGENGLVYQFGSDADLYDKVKSVLNSREYAGRLGRNAYHTICDMWSPENATVRLLSIIEDMVENRDIEFYEDGPCSYAQVVKPKRNRKGKL